MMDADHVDQEYINQLVDRLARRSAERGAPAAESRLRGIPSEARSFVSVFSQMAAARDEQDRKEHVLTRLDLVRKLVRPHGGASAFNEEETKGEDPMAGDLRPKVPAPSVSIDLSGSRRPDTAASVPFLFQADAAAKQQDDVDSLGVRLFGDKWQGNLFDWDEPPGPEDPVARPGISLPKASAESGQYAGERRSHADMVDEIARELAEGEAMAWRRKEERIRELTRTLSVEVTEDEKAALLGGFPETGNSMRMRGGEGSMMPSEERQEDVPLDLDDVTRSIEELCISKAREFALLGYPGIRGEDIWDCVSSEYGDRLPRLHRIVSDILSLRISRYRHWVASRLSGGTDRT
jgi:hypothetical protein